VEVRYETGAVLSETQNNTVRNQADVCKMYTQAHIYIAACEFNIILRFRSITTTPPNWWPGDKETALPCFSHDTGATHHDTEPPKWQEQRSES
jgi:hypothetical protein